MRYFTVKSPSAADQSAAFSVVGPGTDDSGTSWALLKFRTGAVTDPLPTWDGEAKELTREESAVARESALFTANGQPGSVYRQASISFGLTVVESFVETASGFPSVISDRALTKLYLSALSGIEGFVPLLRYQLATTPTQDNPAAPDFCGWTSTAQTNLLAIIDDWLLCYPGKASGEPAGTNPQMATIDQGSSNMRLQPHTSYLVRAGSSGAFTVKLPEWNTQTRRSGGPVVVENLSTDTVTVEIDNTDGAATFGGVGGTTVALAGGERGTFATAEDGASKLWIVRTV